MTNNANPLFPEGFNTQVLPFQKIFELQSGLKLLLSPALHIQAATDAYLRETFTVREEITGRYLFDVFPSNPETPGTASVNKVLASIEQVFATGQPHQMGILQYDIPDPGAPGSFLERYWRTTHTPLLNEQGGITCILHETENVTAEVIARQELKESHKRELLALAKAEQQRLRLERLVEQAPAAIVQLEGPELVYKVINKTALQLFPGKLHLGLPLFEVFPELKEQPIHDIIHQVYRTGETFEGQEMLVPMSRYPGQSPEDLFWNFIVQATFDAQGQVNGILIFALDVSAFVEARQKAENSAQAFQVLNQELEQRVENRTRELRIAQAAAISQKRQLENLFMQAPSAICIFEGPEFTFVLVNPVCQQAFPGRELLGKPLLEAMPELQQTEIPAALTRVYREGESYVAQEMPLMLARYDGGPLEEIYWSFTFQARRNGEGRIDGIMVYAHEVSSQVLTRKAIEASARQLQLITDSLPVLISYLDKNERYQFANRPYEGWFKRKVAEILGKKIVDVIGQKAYENVKDYIKRALAGEQVNYEAAMPYPEGFRYTRTSFVPDVREGEVAGFYALVTDVTEQVNARRALERREQDAQAMARELATANEELRILNLELATANQRLVHTNTDLDNFIYAASHDLKAPISNIEMLMEELFIELPPESLHQKEVGTIVGMMKGAIMRFKKTIGSLTEITKLQKENNGILEPVRIADLVREVSLDLNPLIQKSGARIETNMEDCTTLSFSEKNLRSIVYNLLSNAIKYAHPQRVPHIKIRCHPEGDFLVLQVQDNGLGLSARQQEKLFSMFRRFHDHVEGSGVGLYMVKRIVDNAGGRIEVESNVKEGSNFRVYLRR